MRAIFFLLLTVLPLTLNAAEVYRWTDAEGNVHYSDSRPPADASSAQVKQVSSDTADTALPYAVRRAASAFPVTLYSAPHCGEYCQSARELLQRRGVPFTEKQIETEEDRSAFLQLFNNQDLLPSATVGSRQLSGYEADMWNELLDKVGYPAAETP